MVITGPRVLSVISMECADNRADAVDRLLIFKALDMYYQRGAGSKMRGWAGSMKKISHSFTSVMCESEFGCGFKLSFVHHLLRQESRWVRIKATTWGL